MPDHEIYRSGPQQIQCDQPSQEQCQTHFVPIARFLVQLYRYNKAFLTTDLSHCSIHTAFVMLSLALGETSCPIDKYGTLVTVQVLADGFTLPPESKQPRKLHMRYL